MEANLAYAISNRMSAKHLALPVEQKHRCRLGARLALPMRYVCRRVCMPMEGIL